MKREFTTPVSMVVTNTQYNEDIREDLLSMGYQESALLGTTQSMFCLNGWIYIGTHMPWSEKYVRIKSYNPDLFLSIASMSKGNSFYPGEYVRIDKSKDLLVVIDAADKGNVKLSKDGNGIMFIPFNYLVKATADEIIEHYKRKYVPIWSDASPGDFAPMINKDLPEKVEVKFSFEDKSRDYNAHIDRRSSSGNIELIKKLVDSTGVLGPKSTKSTISNNLNTLQSHSEGIQKAMRDLENASKKSLDFLKEASENIDKICDSSKVTGSVLGTGVIPYSERPPLGIIPRKIWEEQRINELMRAISGYLMEGKLIQEEWIDELNSLLYNRIKPTE